MFIPTTQQEVKALGWDGLDIVLVTGDSYIDSPYVGVALIGKVLLDAGYRVGLIAQPDVNSDRDIKRLGEPGLFWGVTGGCIDSMVANYTATGKRRKQDDYTAGGQNTRRPDRACISYCNLIRRYFKDTVPIVLGGLEASLRRVAHYDFWDNKIRRSILFDARADVLLYGMAERSIKELSDALKEGREYKGISGICYIDHKVPEGYISLPAYEKAAKDKQAFSEMFTTLYRNNDPLTAKGLVQKHGNRYLVQNPPAGYLSRKELDTVHNLPFERDLHPLDAKKGSVRALDTIRFSIPTHRGCYGECHFCAIAVHQGRTVRWRSRESILKEARELSRHPQFKGIISDLGGPTANMYGFECAKKLKHGACDKKRCISDGICESLKPDHQHQVELLKSVAKLPGVKKVFVTSGLRYDLLQADKRSGRRYLKELVAHHVSGQLKVAPEHSERRVLQCMGKPGVKDLLQFRDTFNRMTEQAGKKQFLTYYLIAAHPGCTEEDMQKLKQFASRELKITPEQVQIFTPTPSTFSSLMYYTGQNPWTGEHLFVEKSTQGKERQKRIITGGRPTSRTTMHRKKSGGYKRKGR